jgi:hypothetical protein
MFSTTRALTVGLERLDVELGFTTETSDGEQHIGIVQAAGTDAIFEPGDSCPLDQAYCRRTISLPGLNPADDPGAVVRPHTTLFQ